MESIISGFKNQTYSAISLNYAIRRTEQKNTGGHILKMKTMFISSHVN